MKKILGGVAAVIAVAVVGVLAAAAMQPDQLHVERSVSVAAAPADVFPYASDYERFLTWMPWADLDPDQTIVMSEAHSGVGAWYTWDGNDDVGAGKMTTTDLVEDVKVVQKLEFYRPFENTATATLSLAATGDQTTVTWAYDGTNNFGAKVFGLFVDMDSMLGADFEKGLNRLKPLAEADAVARVQAERVAAEEAAKAAAEAEAAQEATAAAR